MSHYAVEIDLEQPNTSHVQVIDLAASDEAASDTKKVLDVGCWTGEVGRILTERGCAVTGIEIDAEAARLAEKVLDRVVVADLDAQPLTELVEPGTFDVVIFADVLEHLLDPRAALEQARELLAPGGRVVISIPNVTHGSVRLALLQGRWRTTDTGLLDHTHIKFYSREGLVGLFTDAGYAIEDLRGTTADPLTVEVGIDPEMPRPPRRSWSRRHRPNPYASATHTPSSSRRSTAPGWRPATTSSACRLPPTPPRPASAPSPSSSATRGRSTSAAATGSNGSAARSPASSPTSTTPPATRCGTSVVASYAACAAPSAADAAPQTRQTRRVSARRWSSPRVRARSCPSGC